MHIGALSILNLNGAIVCAGEDYLLNTGPLCCRGAAVYADEYRLNRLRVILHHDEGCSLSAGVKFFYYFFAVLAFNCNRYVKIAYLFPINEEKFDGIIKVWANHQFVASQDH